VVVRFVFDGPLGVPVFPVVGWGEGRCPDGFVWLLPESHAAARPTSRRASVRLTPRSPHARAKNRGQEVISKLGRDRRWDVESVLYEETSS
jgi:hypothetical protein